MCTTWSGIIDSSVGNASPEYDSAAYGSSSSTQQAGLLRDLRQLLTTRERHASPGGILEVRQHVQEARALEQLRRQRGGLQPLLVGGDRNELRLEQRERLQRAEIRRRLDQHAAAGIDQRLAEQIERLLRARGDQHVLRIDARRLRRVALRNPFAQLHVAFSRAVLQCRRRVVREHFDRLRAQPLDRKRVRRRQAAGERNDFRPLGDFQDLADGGAGQLLRPLRQRPRHNVSNLTGVQPADCTAGTPGMSSRRIPAHPPVQSRLLGSARWPAVGRGH